MSYKIAFYFPDGFQPCTCGGQYIRIVATVDCVGKMVSARLMCEKCRLWLRNMETKIEVTEVGVIEK